MDEKLIKRVAEAIDGVQLFTRVNDFISPARIEVCRYGKEGEDEIVVIKSVRMDQNEEAVRKLAVSRARAKAAIEAILAA